MASILKTEGTEHLICYPRQMLIESCSKLGIRPIVCRQERVGVGIADGISRSTSGKKIGVFAMQGAAGIENTFPGVAQVYGDNVPVLLLPGGPLGRSYTQPHFRALDNFSRITKWQADMDRPDAVSERMRRAYSNLRTGKPGPVMIEVSDHVATAEIDGELDYTPVKSVRCGPDPADVRTVAELLLKSRRPVIHAGQGVMYAGATDELVKLAELLQAPVMTTNTGKSAFPENHPLSLGASVKSAPKTVPHFLKKADLIVGIGASFAINPWTPKLPPGKRIVHITNDPSDLNKEVAHVAAILGDAKLVLQALIDEIGGTKREDDNTAAEIRAIKDEWLKEWMPELTSSESPINQYRIIHEIMKNVDLDNTIVTHEAGSPREQLVPFWEARAPRSYLGWGKSTQLGHSLGLIMGAKLANPDKLCINFMGDASIGMVGMDIETAVRSRIGILTIVFNNGVMAGEQAIMKVAIEKFGASELGGNYSDVARGLGAWSKRVHSAEEFLPVLRAAIEATQSGVPALIECVAKQNFKYSAY
ncbi:MAG: thiamine pyrophosphate-dependent enzyme possible carboligase or decarboxylase [Noviherbaspirillum sp.]|nr:thiamine pyrophosphate-dependent enzyme possible carboligase or decarboxylase [Noviherbaspirillum sp.]